MEVILASASFDALGSTTLGLGAGDEGDVGKTVLDVEETVLEVEETPQGIEDDCEGDGGRRLWRFRSGSPVTEPDSLSIVYEMLKLDEK